MYLREASAPRTTPTMPVATVSAPKIRLMGKSRAGVGAGWGCGRPGLGSGPGADRGVAVGPFPSFLLRTLPFHSRLVRGGLRPPLYSGTHQPSAPHWVWCQLVAACVAPRGLTLGSSRSSSSSLCAHTGFVHTLYCFPPSGPSSLAFPPTELLLSLHDPSQHPLSGDAFPRPLADAFTPASSQVSFVCLPSRPLTSPRVPGGQKQARPSLHWQQRTWRARGQCEWTARQPGPEFRAEGRSRPRKATRRLLS